MWASFIFARLYLNTAVSLFATWLAIDRRDPAAHNNKCEYYMKKCEYYVNQCEYCFYVNQCEHYVYIRCESV
jgi:hypothetical protein